MTNKLQIITLDEVESSNDFAKALLKKKHKLPFVIHAKNQTKGRGQLNKVWESSKGNSLTISFGIEYSTNKQTYFILNCRVSLACIKYLRKLDLKAEIKWPNDILIQEKKLAGMLIENLWKSKSSQNSVIGIGLNLKTAPLLDSQSRKACALSDYIKTDFDENDIINGIWNELENVLKKDENDVLQDYINCLYRLDLVSRFFHKERQKDFKARIIGIQKNGKLAVKNEQDQLELFDLHEIQLLD